MLSMLPSPLRSNCTFLYWISTYPTLPVSSRPRTGMTVISASNPRMVASVAFDNGHRALSHRCNRDIALQVTDVAQIGGAVEAHLAIEEIGLETNLVRPDRFDVEKRIVGRDGVRQHHRGHPGSGGRGGGRPDIIAAAPNTLRAP